ncbi:MAG: hypothetical protein NTZ64_18815 [Polaromonas sp.]|nr:hypothetical protein [Polaromonas sp.]
MISKIYSMRSRQRGFLYLTTGANGAGKTLNTLKWVRDRQLKESREVYYNGRFEMTADFGWKVFKFEDWQTLPDGAIIVLDECHNDLPLRQGSAPPPVHVRMLAEHRRRGFDFYLITQHPQNIDLFVRRLIGSPGWHRHLKRTFGSDLVSMLEWSAVKDGCERTGSGKDAKVSMVPFPKEVYDWYKSASLHTGKKSIPKQIYFLAALLFIVPLMMYFAYSSLMKPATLQKTQPAAPAFGAPAGPGVREEKKVLTVAEYAQSFQPRVIGFPQSASRYDDISKPAQAPKPAACLAGVRPGQRDKGDVCRCYTQQATPVQVPDDVCRSIAAGGWFDDTLPSDAQPGRSSLPPAVSAAALAPAPAPLPALALPVPAHAPGVSVASR